MNQMKAILKKETLDHIDDFHASCTDCKRCTEFCSFHGHNIVTPKTHAHAILKGHASLAQLESAYDCNACGYCQIKCPQGIDFKRLHVQIKNNLYEEQKKLPRASAERIVDFHQKNMFSQFFNHKTTGFTDKKNRKVFFPGCALIGFQPDTVLSTYEYLYNLNDNIGLMSYCCGNPTKSVGKLNMFKDKFQIVQNQVIQHDIEEIITACPNCHMTLSKELPHVKITHISEALLKYGLPEDFVYTSYHCSNQVTIHDPCPLRYESDIHENVRNIVESLGLTIKARPNSKEHTICCGSGAMVKVVSPQAAKKYTDKFLNNFDEMESIISYCQECVQSLNEGQKTAHHLLDLIFTPHYTLETQAKKVSFMKKWLNRYVYRRNVSRQLDR